jgi:hypothetical protein
MARTSATTAIQKIILVNFKRREADFLRGMRKV